MSLRDDLLPIFDQIARGIPNELGLRRYDLFIRTIEWSGERPGLGTKTVTDTPITVNQGISGLDRPKVVQLKSSEVIASAGRYQDGDWKIGPLTPLYQDSDGNIFGSLPSDIIIQLQSNPTEIFINMKNPDVDTDGVWCKIINTNFSRNFGYTFIIRQTAEVP